VEDMSSASNILAKLMKNSSSVIAHSRKGALRISARSC
jgi:hypothetical protein